MIKVVDRLIDVGENVRVSLARRVSLAFFFIFLYGAYSLIFDFVFFSAFAFISYTIHNKIVGNNPTYDFMHIYTYNNFDFSIWYSSNWIYYTILAISLFTLLRLRDTIFFTIDILLKQPEVFKDELSSLHEHHVGRYSSKTFKFLLFCFFGIRLHKGRIRVQSSIFKLLQLIFSRYLWFCIYFASVFCFVEELILENTSRVWFTTTTDWPPLFKKVGCDVVTVIDVSAELFFTITNNQAVIDALIFLDGLYFDILGYRSNIRIFFALAWPGLQELCHGGYFDMSFNQDFVAQTCSFVFILAGAITPFIMFHSSRGMLDNIWVWLVALLSICLFTASSQLLNDAPLSFIYFVLPETTWRRSYTPFGNFILCLLILMAFTCTMLLIVGTYERATKPFDEVIRERESLFIEFVHYVESTVLYITSNFFSFLFSETIIFAALTTYLVYLVSGMGLPIKRVGFVKTTLKAWPDYADLNYLEKDLQEFSSLHDLVEKLVVDFTQKNVDMLEAAVNTIKCVNIGDIHICISALIDSALDFFANLVKEGERFIIKEGFILVGAAINAIGSFSLAQLEKVIGDIVGIAKLYAVGLYDFIEKLELTFETVPWWFVYIPLFGMILIIGLSVLGLIVPRLASGLQLYLAVGLFNFALGFIIVILSSRRMIENFGYQAQIEWTNAALYDLATLVLVPVSIAQLMNYEPDSLMQNAECQYLVNQFKLDVENDSIPLSLSEITIVKPKRKQIKLKNNTLHERMGKTKQYKTINF